MRHFLLLLITLLCSFSVRGFAINDGAESLKKVRFIIHSKAAIDRDFEALVKANLDQSRFCSEFCYTSQPKFAVELSQDSVRQGYDFIIAVGSDEIINKVGTGLIGSPVPMGIIPIGSGMGLARHLNIPTDPLQAIQLISHGTIQSIDILQINEEYFLGTAGVGFDADIAWKYAQVDRKKYRSYKGLVLKDYLFYRPKLYELVIDGKPQKVEALLITIANSSHDVNGYKMAPHAKLDDGLIDVAILKKPSFYHLRDTVAKIKNGTIHQSQYHQSIACKEVVIKQQGLLAHIDGEPRYFENGATCRVLPRSLNILTPGNQ